MTTWLDVLLNKGYAVVVDRDPEGKYRALVTILDDEDEVVFMRKTNAVITTIYDFGKSLFPEGTPLHWTNK